MSYQEKSAWIMAIVLATTGIGYGVVLWVLTNAEGALPLPTLPALALFAGIQIVIAVVGHIVAAVMAPEEAHAVIDERERVISARSDQTGGYIMIIGSVVGLGSYLILESGPILFYCILGSLVTSQLTTYLVKIVSYRRGF